MALTGRTRFTNEIFTGSHHKTLKTPGLMAQAFAKLGNDMRDLCATHSASNPTFSSGTPGISVGGLTITDTHRYISTHQNAPRYRVSAVTSWATEYQYAPTNTTQVLSNVALLTPNTTAENYKNAITNAPAGDYTINLTTMSLSDVLSTKISTMNYFTIPNRLYFDETVKQPRFSITPISKNSMIELYGDFVVIVGVDIVEKSTGTILSSYKYGDTATGVTTLSPYIDSFSKYTANGYSGVIMNQYYNIWKTYNTSLNYPTTPALPYDTTAYISECLGTISQFAANFQGVNFATPFAYGGLTQYGLGFLCATTETELYKMYDGLTTGLYTGALIAWNTTDTIIQYFIDNVGFGVTINDINAATDPDTTNPGNSPDDGVPTDPIDDNDGDGDNTSDDIEYPSPGITPTSGRRFYALTPADVSQLSNFLFSETFLNDIRRLWNDPGEYIIDLSYYPVDITTTGLDFTTGAPVIVGNVTSEIRAPELLGGIPYIYMGDYTIGRYYNNYMDFDPYTDLSIYLPYIGIRPLNINELMGHKICVGYYLDYATQQVLAAIGIDGVGGSLGQPIAQYTGQIATHIPLSGTSAQTLLANTAKHIIGGANGVTTLATGIASQNPAGIVSGAGGIINSLVPEQIHRVEYGELTATTGVYSPQQAFLIIDRPIAAEPSLFRALNGYSASVSGTVSNFSGFLQCSQAELATSNTMTAAENAEILQLLLGGIYID